MKIVEIPAFVDMHVHFREPGFEYKETIETGLKSAQKAGYEIVCTMPNTKPVCDNIHILNYILEKSKGYSCKLLPVCAITKNLNSEELVDFTALEKAGAVAFSNDGLPILNHSVFYNALKSEKLILSHLEDETKEAIWQIQIFEELTREGFSPRLHFCHISKKSTLEAIKAAKARGLKITCETTPHYFTFTKENVTDTGVFKMNPPLGEESDRLFVIDSVKDGTIDVLSTDHAPHGNEEKLLPYDKSPNGITGLETAFSLTYAQFGLEKTLELMSYNPAKILGVEIKGKNKFDLDKTYTVHGAEFSSKCKVTPYENMILKGVKIDD